MFCSEFRVPLRKQRFGALKLLDGETKPGPEFQCCLGSGAALATKAGIRVQVLAFTVQG